MSHNDKIKDMDAFFEVNPITRQIVNKTPTKIVLMQTDHDSERFTFSLPRYIEGHDMAESAKAELHYINASKNVKGMYEMKDVKVDPDNPDNVICSWLISGNATKEAGTLHFLIKMKCYEGDVLVYSWSTEPHKGISVGEGFDNAEEIAEMYADVLQQWYNDLCIGKSYAGYGNPCVVPSPDEWFAFELNADGSTYSAKANFSNEDAHIVDIVIPATHAGLPVTTIKAGGFSEKENIKSIIIPDTVNVIEEKAFQGCTNLQKVVLPKGIEVLSNSMFENCTSLVQIDLPDSIKEIQYDVFRKTSIEYMNLPYGIKYIGETLFSENTNLKRVHIPDTVTRIDARAFYKCNSLEEIIIPNSVVEMGYNIFTSCKGLKRAVIGTGIKTLTTSDFMYCDALETVFISKAVTNISKDVFWNSSYKPNPNVVLYVEQGSYAEEYAKQYKMKYCYVAISEFPGAVDMSAYLKKTEFSTLFDDYWLQIKHANIAIAPQANDLDKLDVAPSLAVMDYYINKAISEFAQKNGLEV